MKLLISMSYTATNAFGAFCKMSLPDIRGKIHSLLSRSGALTETDAQALCQSAGKLVISSNVRSHWLIEGCEKREINDITRRCCLLSSIRIYEGSYKKKLEFFLNTRAKSHCPTDLLGGFVT